MLVHVGVNPRSVRALCVPIRHEGSIFFRMECEFAHGVFASDLCLACARASLVRGWCVVWGCRLLCAVRGTDRGCGQTRTDTQTQEA